MKIIDYPKAHTIEDYKSAIDSHVQEFSKVDGVIAVYQIGGVSTPGISDIDLVVVFEDQYKYDKNPRLINSSTGNYLFTHGLYGASLSHFKESLKFTFFHNHKLLYGETFELKNPIKDSDQTVLKEQIALEFLIKMYINLIVQKSYRTIKLRSLFLHIKALPYDFEFLNIKPNEILKLIEEGIYLRNNWFTGKISNKDIEIWFKKFFKEYELFLLDLFGEYNLFASSLKFKIAPNIIICNAQNFGYNRKGLVFPNMFNILDKKYFKALNKLNDFKIDVPLRVDAPELINDYLNYANKVSLYNKEFLPYFMIMTSSLKVYK